MTNGSVLAVGVVDDFGVRGTTGVRRQWSDLGERPPGTSRTLRAVFGLRDPTFRRLDAMSRAFVLAAEAAGIRDREDLDRDHAPLIVESRLGALETDLEFGRQLEDPLLGGGLFPYSLSSACLGEVAMRHELRGESLCFAADGAARGVAYREGVARIEAGEARQAMVGCVDVLTESCADADPVVLAVFALLGADGHSLPSGDSDPFVPLAKIVG